MSLNLVQYDDSDEDAPQPAPMKVVPKTETKPSATSAPNKTNDPAAGTKKVIKYASLQTSKNLLGDKKEGEKEEWKPAAFDFQAKPDPNQVFEKANLKSKKGSGYAASFLSNLSKPKRELKNVSQPVMIGDSFVYEQDPEETITKKIKTQTFAQEEDQLEDDEHPPVRDVPHYSSLQNKKSANVRAFTDQDKEMIYNFDKSGKMGNINASQIVEISADSMVDPNWESNAEKRMQSRMLDAKSKFGMPDKAAKSKNQLSAVAYDAVVNQDQYLAQNANQRDAKKKTSERYGW